MSSTPDLGSGLDEFLDTLRRSELLSPARMDAVAPTPFAAEALVRHMGQDKKAEGGKLTFILARALGDAFVAKDVSAQAVRDFLVSEGAQP